LPTGDLKALHHRLAKTVKRGQDETQASSDRRRCRGRGAAQRSDLMKRVAVWGFYAIGALAVLYLALYAYAVFSGRELAPGDPIHIFRKPDAPSYS
jgi:type VI protein secretion system component VasF